MNLSCNIIRDLLPLYAEELVSEDSRAIVDEHLCGCDECTRELGVLKKVQMIPVDGDVTSLRKVKKSILIRRFVAVLTALLTVVSLYCCVVLLMDARIYLNAEDIVESVEAMDDGSIRIRWKYTVSETGSLGWEETPSGDSAENFGIICSNPLRRVLFPKEITPYEALPADMKEIVTEEQWGSSRYQLEGGAANWNIWFCNATDGTGESLLWDAGHPHAQYPFNDVNYHIFWYFLILLGLAAVFMLLCHRRIMPKLTRTVATLFGSIALCVVVTTAGQFMELWGEFTECLVESAILAIPVFATVMCVWQLLDWRKQDKGI